MTTMSEPIPKGQLVEGDVIATLDMRFLNALVLQGALENTGKEYLPVTIDRVERHDELKYENGVKDHNAVLLYFKGSKRPLKLNTTNLRAIASQHGTIGKNWHGKKIALGLKQEYRPDLRAKGPCVRVLFCDPDTGRKPDAF
jgi:hypothetical protein